MTNQRKRVQWCKIWISGWSRNHSLMPNCLHDSTQRAAPEEGKLVLRFRQYSVFSFIAVHTTFIYTLSHGEKLILSSVYMWQMGDLMVHIRSPHHWHLISCHAMASRLVSQHKRNRWPVSIAMRWQLASCHHLLPIACQSGAPWGSKDTEANQTCDWLWCCGWEIMEHLHNSSDLVPSDLHLFGCLKKHLVGKRFATDASVNCHLLTTDTWHQFLLCWVTNIGAIVEQMLTCHCWLNGGMMCALHASKSA